MILRLHRFCLAEMGTFGVMRVGGEKFYTVERPWLDNQPFDSCIPEGVWPLRRSHFHRGGYETFAVTVPGRTHILFHIANVPEDVHGCIGIGTGLWHINGRWGVRESREGFYRWMSRVNTAGEPAYLWVTSGQERDGDG